MSDVNEIRELNDDDAYKEIEQFILTFPSGKVIDILDIACSLNLDDIQVHKICLKILSDKKLITIV